MSKVLITLSGGAANGKTTTLNYLVDEICKTYKHGEIIYRSYSKPENPSSKDKKDKIIIIKDVGDKKLTIGINTAGDAGYIAENSTKLFGFENEIDVIFCDIVICATKAAHKIGKDGSIKAISTFYKKHIDDIKLIPLFKMLFNLTDTKDEKLEFDNDKEMLKIIMEHLAREL